MRAARWFACIATLVAMSHLSGCGYSQLHGARPTPAGTTDITLGAGAVTNEHMDFPFTKVMPTVQLQFRRGLSERVDLGVRPFDLLGLVVDSRLNLLPPDVPFAASVGGELGASTKPFADNSTTLAGLSVMADYAYEDIVAPYLGIGFTNYWFFGYPKPPPEAEGELVEQSYTGDGVLSMTAGVSLFGRALLFEYAFWTRVTNDQGDGFALVDNHIFSMAYTWRL